LDAAARLAQERIELLCRYLPRPLVQHLMTERSAPLGQAAIAAVVFADVSGFTAMSEKMEPEQVLKVMNGCFEGLVDCVERHGGQVDKFIGDCLMAVFGVPLAHEDDATRAIRACLEMFDYLAEYNKKLKSPLGLSVGINYGPLVAGNLGSKTRMDYTVMGNTVNLSQRLEAAASAGQILVSAPVKKAAVSSVEFEPLAPIKVKGISQPVDVYAAIKYTGAEDKKGLQIPCVGRDNFITGMLSKLEDQNKQPVVLELYGNSGLGKTCIVKEVVTRFNQTADKSAKAAVVQASSSVDPKQPYSAIGELVKAVCGISPADPQTMLIQKLSRLPAWGVKQSWLPFLRHTAGAEDVKLGQLDSRAIGQGVVASLRMLLQTTASVGKLIVLDGLEYFDPLSLQVLSRLWPQSPPAGLRLLVTRTPQQASPFKESQWLQSAELPPLDTNGIKAILSARLGTNQIPDLALSFFSQQSGGHPRFLLELIHALEESGHIYKSSGQTIIREDLSSSSANLELASLIRSRIDRLLVDQRYLLQAASLYGNRFPADVVAAAVNKPQLAMDWLKEMADKGLLRKIDSDYFFEHELVRQLATEGLLAQQKAELCHSLGRALEAHSLGQRQESLAQLARLFAASSDVQKADFYLERAGQTQMSAGQHELAAETFLELATVRKSNPKASAAGITQALLHSGRCYEKSGEIQKAQQVFSDAENQAASSQSHLQTSQAKRHLAKLLRQLGQLDQAVLRADTAVEQARLAGDPQGYAWAMLEGAELDLACQNIPAANAKLNEVLKISQDLKGKDLEGSVYGQCLSRLGRISLSNGQTEQAMTYLSQAASVCESSDDTKELVRIYGNLAILHMQNNNPQAEGFFERAIRLAEGIGDRLGEAKQLHNQGSFFLHKGDREAALACFTRSHELATALEWTEGVAINANALKGLKVQNVYDKDTGLANREHLLQRLHQEVLRGDRYRRELSIVIFSIPDLRQSSGPEHQQILQTIANLLRPPLIRGCDLAARFDKHRFALVLPETDSQGTTAVANRIVEHIKSLLQSKQDPDTAQIEIHTSQVTRTQKQGSATQMIANGLQQLPDGF
jgi:diguanylate cyclase (GGDEF)-like protein